MKQVRETSYLRILRPTLEYRAQTLENIQRRAARFVINDYTSRTQGCVTSMLTSLEWQTLEQRRRINRLVMMYKTQHQLVDIDRDSYLRPGDSRTRGQHRFFQVRFNYDTQKLLPKNSTRMEPPTMRTVSLPVAPPQILICSYPYTTNNSINMEKNEQSHLISHHWRYEVGNVCAGLGKAQKCGGICIDSFISEFVNGRSWCTEIHSYLKKWIR
jgi:hypothetical protein